MPMPANARERCREFLEDGERIQYLIPGTSLYVDGVRTRAAFFISCFEVTHTPEGDRRLPNT